MSLTIDISPKALRRLELRASKTGQDVKKVAEQIIEREVSEPTWEELVAPIHDETERLGLTEKDVEELVDHEIAELRKERPLHTR